MPKRPIKKPRPVPVVDADTAPSSYVDWAFPYFHFPPGYTDRSDAVLSLSLGASERFRRRFNLERRRLPRFRSRSNLSPR